MKTHNEKEKKLESALVKLKNLNLDNSSIKESLENLDKQKNQLEIEKKKFQTNIMN